MQIKREGRVTFGDGCLNIWEEGLGGTWEERQAWERQFKRAVFARIVQTLNRLGYTVGPNTYIFTGNNNRYARKGDLRADLKLSGRSISLEFFQNVNAPDRPDHGGRYQSNKERHMPYLMRLEMERTRRRVRAYLLNVFSGYEFDDSWRDGRSESRGPGSMTAIEFVEGCWRTSHHFKGDWQAYRDAHSSANLVGCFNSNRKTADGKLLEQGQLVYFVDRKGRICSGTAYYNINNMWWVTSGKYSVTNEACFSLYADNPGDLRLKRNKSIRRKRLEKEMQKAIARMDYQRAAVLRDVLFPKDQALFLIWHKEKDVYFGPNYSGYTSDTTDAGKYTRDELAPYLHGALETDRFKAVEVRAA